MEQYFYHFVTRGSILKHKLKRTNESAKRGVLVFYDPKDTSKHSQERSHLTARNVNYAIQEVNTWSHIYKVTHPSRHPQISQCARIWKKKKQSPQLAPPLKWLSPGIATPKTWQSPELATPKLRVLDSVIVWGWQVLNLVFSEGGQFRTFSLFWHIAKLGGGKKDGSPFTNTSRWQKIGLHLV